MVQAAIHAKHGHLMTKPRPASCALLRQATALGLPFGQEVSFKLLPGQLLDDRLLLGWQSRDFPPAHFVDWLQQTQGLPGQGAALLHGRAQACNTVGLSVEAGEGPALFKAYLEFWDPIRDRMRAGTFDEAALLHYGVKWQAGSQACAQAEYHLQPYWTSYDIVKRIRTLHPAERHSLALGTANALVQRGSNRTPRAPMLYMEAKEAGNARHSCDINLYKTGLQLHDAADLLRQLATSLAISTPDFEPLLQAHQDLPLGHVAAGIDRHAQEFLSVYLGVHALPA